jgi:hypothetical protein
MLKLLCLKALRIALCFPPHRINVISFSFAVKGSSSQRSASAVTIAVMTSLLLSTLT